MKPLKDIYSAHMNRKWIEIASLTLAFGLIYFSPIQASRLPVFSGQFNNLDGSLYAVRLFDTILSVMLVIVASRYLIPGRLNWASILKNITALVGILATGSLLEYGWDALMLVVFNLPTGPGEVSDKMLMYSRRETLDLTIITGNLIVIAGGLFYGLVRDRNQHLHRQERLELKNLEAEVKYLRSQLNPHFLFNTLNNIFAITQRNQDQEGSDALLRLSGLMRYMLYDSAVESIGLRQEIEHLQNYIEIMLLKYKKDDPPDVDFQIEGDPDNLRVAPLILLPFVENSFKHGIDSKGRGSIHINLNASRDRLNFSVINTAFPDRTASKEHQGIGLDNVKKRLELHYPNQHDLAINVSDVEFKIVLRITL